MTFYSAICTGSVFSGHNVVSLQQIFIYLTEYRTELI